MSLRDISAANITALNASVVRPIAFVRMDFAGGVRRIHSEIGPRTAVHPTYGSESYLGVGDFGGFSAEIVESVSNAAQALRISLTGLDSNLVSDAFTDDYHGRDIEIMLGFDDVDGVLEDDPVILWSGFMDKIDISLDQARATMTLNCESRATRLQSISDKRFTDEQLQNDYTGDVAGEYIFRMLDIQLRWGGENVNVQSGGYGGGSRWAPSLRLK